jgi:pilus assembly protein CpaD
MNSNPRALLSLAAIFSAALLSGCMPLFKTEKDVFDVEERHPIVVEPDMATVSVPVADKAAGLDPQGARDLRAFLAVYKARGHGPLTVARPLGSSNEKVARRVSDDILRLATEVGVDPIDVMPQTYQVSAGAPSAPVTVSFTRFVASVGPCGDWTHNYASTPRNLEMPNFGCATQNNIAAMLEDPHDLVGPRNLGPADAERRTQVFAKYRKGVTTVTDRATTERADVAKVGAE